MEDTIQSQAKEGASMKGFARALIVAAISLTAVGAAPAAAESPPTPVAPLQLSLGDSWAAGAGASAPSEAYVPQLHAALREELNCSGAGLAQSDAGCPQLDLLNVARGGATTPSMIATQFPQALPVLEARNGNLNPRDDVEVTTLHIGGNDVTNPIIAACVVGGLTPACLGVIQSELGAYASDLDTALAALRAAAGPEATMVIGTYDNGIANCFLAGFPGAVQLADLVLEGGGPVPQGLHDIMRATAARYGFLVAEVYGDLDPGDWVGGQDCLHPVDSGYDKVTSAFLESLGLA
jgi:GDSL-like Lipase/Acylhydrolase family